MKAVIGGVLAAGLLVSPAFAQSSPGTWNGLSDRFQIDTGYFRIDANTVLRYNGDQDIDFEQDLGVDEQADTFWLEATWRVGRRHKLKLGYTKLDRDRADYTLERDFSWAARPITPGSPPPRRPGATSSAVTTALPSSATSGSRSGRRSASATSG